MRAHQDAGEENVPQSRPHIPLLNHGRMLPRRVMSPAQLRVLIFISALVWVSGEGGSWYKNSRAKITASKVQALRGKIGSALPAVGGNVASGTLAALANPHDHQHGRGHLGRIRRSRLDEYVPLTENETEDEFMLDDSLMQLEEYIKAHPDFLTAVVFWFITGQVFVLVGLFLVLYSEIKMVCLMRAQDSRRALLGTQTNVAVNEAETEEREQKSVVLRPYITLVGSLSFFLGFLLCLIPMCDVLHLLGLPTGVTCIYIIALEAFTFTLVFTLFLMGATWSCTRPWAAAVLIVLSIFGLVLCPTANVLLLLLFLFITFSVYMVYFHWYPEYLREQRQEAPAWLESVGSLHVSLQHQHWLAAGQAITVKPWEETVATVGGDTSTWSGKRDD